MDLILPIAAAPPDAIAGIGLADLLTYATYGAFALIIITLVAKLISGAKDRAEIERRAEQEAALFEMSMLRGPASAQPAYQAPPAPRPESAELSANASEPAPVVAASAAAAPPRSPYVSGAAYAAPAAGGGPGNLSPLAETVIARLKQANLIDYVEGPVRSKNPAITGTTIIMRSTQRFAILDLAIRQNDADFEILMRQFDGVVMPGPGKDPLFVKRFEYFISDHISL